MDFFVCRSGWGILSHHAIKSELPSRDLVIHCVERETDIRAAMGEIGYITAVTTQKGERGSRSTAKERFVFFLVIFLACIGECSLDLCFFF